MSPQQEAPPRPGAPPPLLVPRSGVPGRRHCGAAARRHLHHRINQNMKLNVCLEMEVGGTMTMQWDKKNTKNERMFLEQCLVFSKCALLQNLVRPVCRALAPHGSEGPQPVEAARALARGGRGGLGPTRVPRRPRARSVPSPRVPPGQRTVSTFTLDILTSSSWLLTVQMLNVLSNTLTWRWRGAGWARRLGSWRPAGRGAWPRQSSRGGRG